MSVAVIFPGLAPSDYESVKDFVEKSPYAHRRFEYASEILGFSLRKSFREATEDQWEVFQCAFLANSLALSDWAEEKLGMKPSVCVGASFGGFGAAIYTGSLSYNETLLLTYESTLQEKQNFSGFDEEMGTHFFYRLTLNQVQDMIHNLREQGHWVEFSSYLSEDIHAVCATVEAIEIIKQEIRKQKGISLHTMKRLVHSSKLKNFKDHTLKTVYNRFSFRDLTIPFVSDVDGMILEKGEDLKNALLDGYDHPVRWPETVNTLKRLQVSKVFVVGPRNLFGPLSKEHFEVAIVSPEMTLESVAN
ncbi:ACP S-malonyltransferase [Desmospora activa]|uniref:[acyl-carrier-protein] S-malonyltransferase n=1 Tax=Desmospora activa DSM 45169 TaxID=1121389 RepID=A0A2T4ZAD2_9BACL|nr:ACP S-malonyltransferase [Desmospora activa]PTM58842.1 [acyl-carrier-protein] S-malonyltransferase [Desmospora activa DSM 45169]